MSMTFNLLLPRQVHFGWGRRNDLGNLARSVGTRALLIGGSRTLRHSPVWQELLGSLTQAGLTVEFLADARREPTIEDVDTVTAQLLEQSPRAGDIVIGIGGGAALDLAKAVAAMATNARGASVRDFLEGIGTGRTLTEPPLPMIAVPTTSGTGSEATKNAVISCAEPPCKKSLRSDRMVPAIVLIDPELTGSLPPAQTAYSGLDAITQLIESFTSKRSQPFTDALCLTGLQGAVPALRTAFHNGSDQSARETMAYAAWLSGVALANSGLGVAHGVAAALGSICDVPHGLACAVMLPIAMQANLQVAREKLTTLAPLLTGHADATAEQGIAALDELLNELQIPRRLRDLGVQQEQLPEIAAGSKGNSLSGNPRSFKDGELQSLLEELW